MSETIVRRLEVPLSRSDIVQTDKCRAELQRTRKRYVQIALDMLLTLDEHGISDGLKPFFIDGDEYTPPTYPERRTYTGENISVDILRTDFARVEPLSARDDIRPGLYVARAILLRNDLQEFDISQARIMGRGPVSVAVDPLWTNAKLD